MIVCETVEANAHPLKSLHKFFRPLYIILFDLALTVAGHQYAFALGTLAGRSVGVRARCHASMASMTVLGTKAADGVTIFIWMTLHTLKGGCEIFVLSRYFGALASLQGLLGRFCAFANFFVPRQPVKILNETSKKKKKMTVSIVLPDRPCCNSVALNSPCTNPFPDARICTR
jgi:hypothetical protein